MRKILLFTLIATSLHTAVEASVTIQFEFSQLRNSSGVAISSPTVAVLIADTNGDGVLPTSTELLNSILSFGSFVGGNVNPLLDTKDNADTIIFAGLTDSDPESGNFNGTAPTLDLSVLGLATGDIFGVYWFPGISSTGATVGAGQSYGKYLNSTFDSATSSFGANSAMVIPADPTSSNVQYYDTGIMGLDSTVNTPSISNFTASYSVVPEPSTLVLSALGLAALLRRRRN